VTAAVIINDESGMMQANIVTHYTLYCVDHDVDGPGIVHTGEDVCFWARGPGWTDHPRETGEVEMTFFLNEHGTCALDICRNVREL